MNNQIKKSNVIKVAYQFENLANKLMEISTELKENDVDYSKTIDKYNKVMLSLKLRRHSLEMFSKKQLKLSENE